MTDSANPSLDLDLPDPEATDALGAALAATLPTGALARSGGLIELHGDLGTGKTALTRALLRALGITGTIRSPTYTLLESYPVGPLEILHLDLYRLADPAELEALDHRELAAPNRLALVEWPERGRGWLPAPTLIVTLDETLNGGRHARLEAVDAAGGHWLAMLVGSGQRSIQPFIKNLR